MNYIETIKNMKPVFITWVMVASLLVFGILSLLVDGNGEILGMNEFVSFLLGAISAAICTGSALIQIISKKYNIVNKILAVISIIICLALLYPFH